MTKNDLEVLKNYELTLKYATKCGIEVHTSTDAIVLSHPDNNSYITAQSFSETVEFVKGYAWAMDIDIDAEFDE